MAGWSLQVQHTVATTTERLVGRYSKLRLKLRPGILAIGQLVTNEATSDKCVNVFLDCSDLRMQYSHIFLRDAVHFNLYRDPQIAENTAPLPGAGEITLW